MDGGTQKTSSQQEEADWEYKGGDVQGNPSTPAAAVPHVAAGPDDVEWTASEYVAHQKGPFWYVIFGAGGLVVAAGIYLITHDVFSVVVISILAGILGYYSSRTPRVLTYRLDHAGLTIANKFHPYGEFKSFAVVDEGAFSSIVFASLKRFMPPVSIYFAPDDEQRVTEMLASHLPMQPADRDGFDRLMRSIRF